MVRPIPVKYPPWLVRIIKWCAPYWNPKPDIKKIEKQRQAEADKAVPKADRKKARAEAAKRKKRLAKAKKLKELERQSNEAYNSHGPDGDLLLMRVLNYPKPLSNAPKFKRIPKLNTIWYYHDRTHHQTWAHVAPRSGYRATRRDNAARHRGRPIIYPRQGKPFDRTHVLPIGYHGSENDPRLVIGWDSNQNRHELNEFEQRQKKRPNELLWLTDVRRTKYGAAWRYLVYDAKTRDLLDQTVVKMGNEKHHVNFVWDPTPSMSKEEIHALYARARRKKAAARSGESQH